ncbi:LysR family transcriptional regulator [Paeniglutamicibacter sp. ABSL32-1]|uniref:LysR family transcriptional regulator n=1 Tax=Paeniglutamicibacter quisquiliarum TaxID=2849498 RepID=UPI001C2D0125|nr:LysR family transcriptional regulator [Paeniglutamicibacter quisquiliarum]MBV1777581.1 LysR family transcriptional regulator [Paeniglutamicibacter quisquiliarum]
MSELTLRQLEYFAAVAETQSVTHAARLCHVSQGAVSLALGQLEHALGVTLAMRQRGRGIALTPEGQEVATRARFITEQVERLRDAVSQVHAGLSGRLSIGVFTTVAVHVVPHLIDWFCTRHPEMQLSFVEGSGPEIQEALFAGRTQLSIGYETQFGQDCTVEVLQEFHRKVVVSPGHPLAEFEEISLAQLTQYPAAFLNLEPALQHTLAEFQRHGVTANVGWLLANVPSIHSIVGRGLAYSLLMQPTESSMENRPLVFRPLSDETQTNSLVAAMPKGVSRSAMVTEALAALHGQWS